MVKYGEEEAKKVVGLGEEKYVNKLLNTRENEKRMRYFVNPKDNKGLGKKNLRNFEK